MEKGNNKEKVEFDDLLKEPEVKVEEVKQPSKKQKQDIPKADNEPTKKEPIKEPEKKVNKEPYVHIDDFLQTATHYFGMSNMQAQGFKSKMNGRHYQRGEQGFVNELKKYLNIK